jgi:hypothetical protein
VTVSIWTSLTPASGHETRGCDLDHGDEYGNDNPRDVVIDIAVAYEQIRLAAWTDWSDRVTGKPYTSVSLLLPRKDAEALRDLLDMALNRHATTGGTP